MASSILTGDVRECLRGIPDGSVHCVVTSPPYWGLRDYQTPPQVWGGDAECEHEWGSEERGRRKDMLPAEESKSTGRVGTDDRQGVGPPSGGRFCRKCNAWLGNLGLDPTVELYVEHIVQVFHAVRRVLRDDGTLWLNMGDCYSGGGGYWPGAPSEDETRSGARGKQGATTLYKGRKPAPGLKPKDLVGQPWRVAFALQADGWYLRSDIIWAKPNPMPESCRDRPTKAHEYVFLMTKRARYFFDQEAVREVNAPGGKARIESSPGTGSGMSIGVGGKREARLKSVGTEANGRNIRSVWTIPTQPFPEAHFATFPEALPERCIRAGTSEKGCCPACGASWVRVVERTKPPEVADSEIDRYGTGQAGIHRKVGGQYQKWLDANPPTTTGWEPSCDCQNEDAVQAWDDPAAIALAPPFDPIPCTVLDPFVGSGTTALVAVRLGRSVVGIDLSEKYTDMIRKQLAVVSEGDSRRPKKVRVKRRRFRRAKKP